jgi:hypothetical protein
MIIPPYYSVREEQPHDLSIPTGVAVESPIFASSDEEIWRI